jgi:hypothetical protein
MFDALLMELASKAMSGDIKSFEEVIRLIKKLQEQEPYLNAAEFVVNFIDPVTKNQVIAEVVQFRLGVTRHEFCAGEEALLQE